MNPKILGGKLRALRREQHLTQDAVCGDTISRNLLSRIETGHVTPSLDTLCFLADRLSAPPGYLLSETEDRADYQRPGWIAEMRRCYQSKAYAEAEALAAEHALRGEEVDLLLCLCAEARGMLAYRAGDLSEADVHFARALALAEGCFYPTEEIEARVRLYRSLVWALLDNGDMKETKLPSDGGSVTAQRYLLELFFACDPKERVAYMAEGVFTHPVYRQVVAAKMAADAGRFPEAQMILTALLHEEGEVREDPHLYRRCVDLAEAVSAAVGDYKQAYAYAKEKQMWHDGMQRKTHTESRSDDGDNAAAPGTETSPRPDAQGTDAER